MNKSRISERKRKLIGIAFVTIYLIFYCLIAAAIGEWFILGNGILIEITYFAIAGFIWIFPVIRIFRWMDDLIKR